MMPAVRPAARWALTLVALAAATALGLAADLAQGERTQEGELIVSLSGGLQPRKLPRHELAPAAVRLSGELRTADRSPLPRMQKVVLEMAGGGVLDTRGLPTCPREQLTFIAPEDAVKACRPALVGRGRLVAEVFFPDQETFTFRASLRAFNGRLPDGRRVIWLHVYGSRPPSSFVLPFVIHRRKGAFGTALVAAVPSELGPWPHFARFRMTFSRRFSYHGRTHSYINANCPVPPAFTAGFFPFARATYSFEGDRAVSATIVRGCRVRGGG